MPGSRPDRQTVQRLAAQHAPQHVPVPVIPEGAPLPTLQLTPAPTPAQVERTFDEDAPLTVTEEEALDLLHHALTLIPHPQIECRMEALARAAARSIRAIREEAR